MPIGIRSLSALLLVMTVLALAFGGCSDDDDDNPLQPEEPASYPTLSTPQNVLEAYELAYTRRDTIMVRNLFDSTYTGASVDLNDPGSGTLLFTYADEIAHVRALATTPDLLAYLDLGAAQFWDVMPSDDPSHPEWAIIQIFGSLYRVETTEAQNSLVVQGEAGTFLEFAFSPEQDSTSPTDTLWRIVRWRETGASGP